MDKRAFIEKILKESGEIVKQSFGEIVPTTRKIEKTQLVTEIDVASERLLIENITNSFPESGIIAEESGFIPSKDGSFWVIDPIDGTSNFANALPWFGVMVAYIQGHSVKDAGIFLPLTDELYVASDGMGAHKNGQKISLPRNIVLEDSLVSLCFSSMDAQVVQEGKIFRNLSSRVLNIRSTNSAYDYAYASEGKFAAMINLVNKIWDVAPVCLIARESGMKITELDGNPLHFALTEETYAKNYTVIISNPSVSEEIRNIIS